MTENGNATQWVQTQAELDSDESALDAAALIKNEDDWFMRNGPALALRLDASVAEEKKGTTFSAEEARRMLAARRASRAA